ncbi:MAG: FlgD immunoglobulin-like domain containing protein [bacterium]
MRIAVLTATLAALALASGGTPLPFTPLWADHDTGNVRLSVTSVGGIGYTDPVFDAGSGMKFPKTAATSALYHGALLVGNSVDYVADRFFGLEATADHDFGTVESLERASVYGLQEYRCKLNDAAHPAPKGLTIQQHSIASPDSGYKDFVTFLFEVENTSSSAVNGLYAGIWCDFDIATATNNVVATDTTRRAIWMKPSATAEYPTVGIKILGPAGWANLSACDHDIYVYPDSGLSDNMKYRFLNGTIRVLTSNRPYDWSIVASWGPFDLAPGATQHIDFALLGGITVADFQMNCDSAQAFYTHLMGVAEQPEGPARIASRVSPNPFSGTTRLTLGSDFTGPVDVTVYDAAGNVVKTLWQGTRPGAVLTWDGRDQLGRPVQNGVYLLQVKSATRSHTAKVTLAR